MGISKVTIFLGAYIIISASFAQQLWRFGQRLFGKPALLAFFVLLCATLLAIMLYISLKRKLGALRLALVFIITLSSFIFAWKQPFIAEKLHIIEYGLLAWLAMRDLDKKNRGILMAGLLAFIFASTVGVLDEGFQKILPWRVFEIRDMITNSVSAIFGIAAYLTMKK